MSRVFSVGTLALAIVWITIVVLCPSKPAIQGQQSTEVPLEAEAQVLEAEAQLAASAPSFVGREVCGECHQENFQLHAKSGHASTFTSTRDPRISAKFAGKTLDAGEPYGVYQYEADADGLQAKRLSDPEGESFPLEYALGSGHNAITLLSLIQDADDGTIGIEHRVSWFAMDDTFGLTPGQAGKVPESHVEYYGNPVRGESMRRCVDCHTTTGTINEASIDGLVANVNCEKCHGPGSEHVRQARLSQHPPAFSVGKDDWAPESEIQLCGSCHRLPIDISPKQLREYPRSLARFQPIGMLRSECFLQSEGEMKCTTCHNPHQNSTAKTKADYIDDCVRCHQENTAEHVVCPVSPRTGCIECHMPPLKFEQGMVFHDHWIRVRAQE